MEKLIVNIIEFILVDERISYVWLKTKPFNMKKKNYMTSSRWKQKNIKIRVNFSNMSLRAFNGFIGKEDYISQVAGIYTIKINVNGQRLFNLAARTNTTISCTKLFTISSISSDQKTHTQIDHVGKAVINERCQIMYGYSVSETKNKKGEQK